MSITPLSTPPTPPNGDLDRAMTVWINGAVGNANDPIKSDSAIQSLLNFCGNNGVNVVALDFWSYLGGGNWSSANASQVARAVHYLRASGISVLALCGNSDWGHNQYWVAQNVLKALQQFQQYCQSAQSGDDMFDGVLFDVEYWTQSGYTSVEPIGLCDLMVAARRMLGIAVGCTATQWLATSAALTITYGGATQYEGLCLVDCADYVWVMSLASTAANQETMFGPWYTYASATGVGRNKGLWLGCETSSGLGSGQSYWTGASGAKSAMESQLSSISSNYKPASPSATNLSYLGAGVNAYYVPGTPSGWSQMS